MLYKFMYKTENSKTGPIAASYAEMDTCPDTCLHYRSTCYAGLGDTVRQWKKVTQYLVAKKSGNETGISLSRFVELIKTLPRYSIFRYGIAGDFPGLNNTLDLYALKAIVKAAVTRRLRAFAYTHKKQRHQIEEYKKLHNKHFVINLSCDTVGEVDSLFHHGLPLVLTVPSDFPSFARTEKGVRLIECLYSQTNGKTQCKDCGGDGGPLCARVERDYAITFPAHGTRKRMVSQRFAMPDYLKKGIVDID